MPRKLKYGQGSIVKRIRKNKKGGIYKWYEAKWFDEYGRQQRKTCKTKAQARAVLLQYNKRSLRNLSKKEYLTFGVSMHQWYKEFRMDGACKERNEHNIREINRLPKDIYNKQLQQVTAQELQKHLNDMKHDNPRVTAKALLSSFLNFMFLQGALSKDIGKLLKAPLPRRAEKQVLTPAMETKFLELLPEKFRKYAIGLIYTGCRYSEFINIQAEDVNKVNKTIVIRDTKSIRANDRRRGIHYKTRVIPLLPQLENYEFPLQYISQSYFQRCFVAASEKLGIKVTPHDMRHTFATRCDDYGVKEKVIQGILGHKTERMTRHYKDHKTAELMESEFNKIRTRQTINVVVEDDVIDNQLILTLEEEARFIKSFPESWREHITALIYTGCTFAEIISIREEDIDKDEKTIFIQEIETGRDANPARTIPLLPPVEQIKFPLEKRSPKYFINCFHIASERLGKKVLAKDLPAVFVARLKEYKTSESTAISTAIRSENDLKNDGKGDL